MWISYLFIYSVTFSFLYTKKKNSHIFTGSAHSLSQTCSFPFCVHWCLQIHKNSVEGRILHGNSPTELIECFTETIGRPPKLPDWIISGAVVGMQGGTESVRRIWNELKSYNAPVSAFWLQVCPSHAPKRYMLHMDHCLHVFFLFLT